MKALDRFAAWFLRADPTTACEWTAADEDDLATKYARLLFENAALKAEVERLDVECEALNQENMRLHLELTEAQLWAGGGPKLRLVRDTTPPVASDDDWFARLYDERGNVR